MKKCIVVGVMVECPKDVDGPLLREALDALLGTMKKFGLPAHTLRQAAEGEMPPNKQAMTHKSGFTIYYAPILEEVEE